MDPYPTGAVAFHKRPRKWGWAQDLPLLRGAGGEEECSLAQWELKMHSRKDSPQDLGLIFVLR